MFCIDFCWYNNAWKILIGLAMPAFHLKIPTAIKFIMLIRLTCRFLSLKSRFNFYHPRPSGSFSPNDIEKIIKETTNDYAPPDILAKLKEPKLKSSSYT